MKKTRRHNKTRSYFSIIFPILTIIGIGMLFTFSSFYEKGWSYNWNGISEQVRDSVKVAQYDYLSNQMVRVGLRKTEKYDRRWWIMKNASKEELLKLTKYPNGTIKTIAYEGLLRNPDFKDKTDLILKSFNETEYPLDYRMGCVGSRMYISEYLIDFILYLDNQGPPLPEGLYNRFRLAENDVEKIMIEYRNAPSLWR